jgi:signal transduction histidine kinase
MKRLVPNSIAGRILMVLLVGLTLSHMASTAILSSDRRHAMVSASDTVSADRIGVFAQLIDRAPGGERSLLVRSLDSPLLRVALGTSPDIPSPHMDETGVDAIRQSLEQRFGLLGHDRLHVTRQRHEHDGATSFWQQVLHGFPGDDALLVALRLGDGTWATFDLTMPSPPTLWDPHSLLSALVMIAAILVLGKWAAGWIAAPLASFTQAAERLGRDVQAPPMPEEGPDEVHQVAVAFNEMQGRIRRFVEDRTRMLAAISHDLRSPITRLRLRAEMLPTDETRARMLADLAEMEAMVTSTLDFARGETDDEASQAIDLAATLAAICDNASDMGLPAEFDWPGRLVCACRPLAMKRALANLVENAARYGGRAMVSACRASRDIVVTVEDQGPGIPEAQQESVFTPFFRLEGSRNRKTGGIGLGLTVARTIIRSHGGDVRLENRKEGGLRVTVTIPQGEEP